MRIYYLTPSEMADLCAEIQRCRFNHTFKAFLSWRLETRYTSIFTLSGNKKRCFDMNLFLIPQANTKLAINQLELHAFSRALVLLVLRMEVSC